MLLQITAEIQTYFINNYTQTPFQIDGVSQTFNGTISDEYIKIRYVPEPNGVRARVGVEEEFGTLQVYCYHKSKTLARKLSDDIRAFLSDKDLPQRVRVNTGSPQLDEDVGNNFWCVLVHFPIEQL